MSGRSRNLPIGAAIAAVLVACLLLSLLVRRSDSEASTEPPLRVAIVGDDYSAGRLNRVVWPTLMAERSGWSVSNVALPGAGYVADGAGGYAFTYQVERALNSDPDVILVVGGLQDTGYTDPEVIRAGVLDAIDKVTRHGRPVLVVGPIWYEKPAPASVTRVSDEVRRTVESRGVSFRDGLDPPWLTPRVMQNDRAAPTDEGQSVLADEIAEFVREELHR